MGVELIAGKADDDELVGIFGRDFFPQFFEALELGREAAFGGGVDGEDHFARVLREGVFGAFLVFGREVEEGGCGGHGRLCSV